MNINESLKSAIHYFQKDDLAQAEYIFNEILKVQPNNFNALHFLGLIFYKRKEYDSALEYINKALYFEPNYADAHSNLGIVLQDIGQLQEAETHYKRALQLNPKLVGAYYGLGIIYQSKGQLNEALTFYQKVTELNPNFALAYNNLGTVLGDKDHFDKAVPYFQKAIELNPNFTDAFYNLGNALQQQGKINEAIIAYEKVIFNKPKDVKARLAKCMAHIPLIYQDESSIEIYRIKYHYELLKLQKTISLETTQDIKEAADAIGCSQPFYLPCQGLNDRELQQIYGSLVYKIMTLRYPQYTQILTPLCMPQEPIRIGFISGFFYRHSVWKIPLKGWIENLNKQRFKLYGYYTGNIKDHETEIARQYCTRFVEDIYSFDELCKIILGDNLHVLIYPEIGIDRITFRLATLRLAPVQCTSLGHPQTSGLPTIDYYLSSDLMEPTDADDQYTEQLIRLPNLSFFYSPLDVPSVSINRETFSLRPKSILYLCSHSLFTFHPQHDDVFPLIAQYVGDCQFLFISYYRSNLITERFRQRIRKIFDRYKLDADNYIVFLPFLDPGRYHAINCLSDIFLDSIGWSANNSTFEAIACNLPVVTFPGKLMRQRHCAGILTMMGMTETIASSIDEYVDLAARLGLDLEWRHQISEKIAANRHRIYRDKRCIAALENFFEKVLKKLN